MKIRTVGHSNHRWEYFEALIQKSGVQLIADVRSNPYSRRFPHFGSKRLINLLNGAGIDYRYFGDRLGGHPSSPDILVDGRVDYNRVAQTTLFQEGLQEVSSLAQEKRIALMCAEHDPLQCHRFALVSRHLAEKGVDISHIMRDGRVEPQWETENRMLRAMGLACPESEEARQALVAQAYDARGAKMTGGSTRQSSKQKSKQGSLFPGL